MGDEFDTELRDSGGQRALYLALIAVLESHPQPARAKSRALAAIEIELVPLLHRRDTPAAWLEAFQDMQGRLATILDDRWPGR